MHLMLIHYLMAFNYFKKNFIGLRVTCLQIYAVRKLEAALESHCFNLSIKEFLKFAVFSAL